MRVSRSTTRQCSIFALAVVVAGCGAGGKQSVASPSLCAQGSSPVVAAYSLTNGSLRWVACDPHGGLFVIAAATEDTVWVQHPTGTQQEYRAFDASSGKELRRSTDPGFASEIPAEADKPVQTPPVIDGVQLTGGQDNPVAGIDAANRTTRWTRPGHLVYDDAWAVGDGAVFAVENDQGPVSPSPHALVAYEVATGKVRWRKDVAARLWPFHVNGKRLLVMWNNLQVLNTKDGSLLWETHYAEPKSGFPRMMGGVVDSRSVFVSFTTEASGGD